MTKDPRTMTPAEKKEWTARCEREAREYLFSIGQPLVYRRADGQMVAEYKDGVIKVLA
jgi:hypothetical protein